MDRTSAINNKNYRFTRETHLRFYQMPNGPSGLFSFDGSRRFNIELSLYLDGIRDSPRDQNKPVSA